MDPAAVIAWAAAGNPVVLDVFPGEPRIDPALVRAADIATPHVAGHAWDGKLRGTAMVAEALKDWLGVKAAAEAGNGSKESRNGDTGDASEDGSTRDKSDDGGTENVSKDGGRETGHSAVVLPEVLEVVRGVYDIRIDDASLRKAVEMEPDATAAEFARLRAEYRVRREFASCEINAARVSAGTAAMLRTLGFIVR